METYNAEVNRKASNCGLTILVNCWHAKRQFNTPLYEFNFDKKKTTIDTYSPYARAVWGFVS